MNYKQKRMISVKTKTITLVLAIYLVLSAVFFFIRYLDIKDFAQASQNSELLKVKLVYNQTLKRTSKFYITRGYANINSFGIKEAFSKNDADSLYKLSLPRWNIIRKENKYLKSFCFYNKDGKLITYFGKKPQNYLLLSQKNTKSYDGFWQGDNSLNYHTVSIAKDKNSDVIGFITFVIDPQYFLFEIKKLMNIHVYIIYKDSDSRKNIFMLKDDKVAKDTIKSEQIENLKVIETKNGIFQPYIINGIGIDSQNSFKIIFLQDISHWKNTLQKAILQSLIAMIILILITAGIISYGFDMILKELDESNRKLRKSQNELEDLNKNLQIKIKKEIQLKLKKEREANEKERILAHQSKLASMGEMIGNIAHQWRQPLTQLSSILISLELYFERGKLTKDRFQVKAKEANEQINFMSRTIDDFRNFFTSKKEKEYCKVSYAIGNVEKLLLASLKNNDIDLMVEIKDDFDIYGFPNEISQAFINILSNAKDVILEKGMKNGVIHIEAFLENDKKIVIFTDNAGGIKVDPIDKIFEPYFSTKHAKSGTGIGLYMTKTIIEKNNNGKIEVQNIGKGAVFTVIF